MQPVTNLLIGDSLHAIYMYDNHSLDSLICDPAEHAWVSETLLKSFFLNSVATRRDFSSKGVDCTKPLYPILLTLHPTPVF